MQDLDDRFESWKAIAAYLQRDVRTLHRWERQEGLPVHRHLHQKGGTIYAFRAELDAWLRTRAGAAPPRRPSGSYGRAAAPKTMLAVLPFENLTGATDEDYLSDGLTEDVITQLGRLYADRLGIIARTSVMQYRGTRKSVREIGRELQVQYVVEGSVRRHGNRVRITAQLIAARDQRHLWAKRYDRPLRDIFALQDELAEAVARAIGVALEVTSRLPRQSPGVAPAALEAYLKGRFHWYQLSQPHFDTALDYFQLALAVDPHFALAYEGIARVWLLRADTGLISPSVASSHARAAAFRALELDGSLAAVHVTLANCRFCLDWEWDDAEREFQIALNLNSNAAEAHFFYADFLISMGRTDEALDAMTRALRLDPFNPFFRCFQAWHLIYLDRPDEAITLLKRTLRVQPAFASARLGLWGAFHRKRMYDAALAEARRFFAGVGDHEVARALAVGAGGAGYRRAMSRAADLLASRAATTHVPAVRIARVYAHAAERNRAMAWLEEAYRRRESPLVHLDVAWDWRLLRDEPRFRDLRRRMNFPAMPGLGATADFQPSPSRTRPRAGR